MCDMGLLRSPPFCSRRSYKHVLANASTDKGPDEREVLPVIRRARQGEESVVFGIEEVLGAVQGDDLVGGTVDFPH